MQKKLKQPLLQFFFWLLYKYNKCLLEIHVHVQRYITPLDFPKLKVYPNVQLMVGWIIS